MAGAILASSGIYVIRNTINGKVYVGSSVNLRKRKQNHFRNLLHGTHANKPLQNAFIKYGSGAFEFVILEAVRSKDDLIDREQYWIDRMQSVANGYNLRPKASSNLGMRHSDDARARISAKLSEYLQQDHVKKRMSAIRSQIVRADLWKKRIGDGRRGKIISPQVLANIRAAALKKSPPSAESKKKCALSMRGKHAGSNNPMSKITEDGVRAMRRLWGEGVDVSAIASRFCMSKRHVRDIVNMKAWSHIK